MKDMKECFCHFHKCAKNVRRRWRVPSSMNPPVDKITPTFLQTCRYKSLFWEVCHETITIFWLQKSKFWVAEGNDNFLGARNSSSSCDLFVKETYICWPFSSCCTSFSSDTFNYFGFSVYLFAPYFSPSSPCFKTPIINGLFSVSFSNEFHEFSTWLWCEFTFIWQSLINFWVIVTFSYAMYYWHNKLKSLTLPFCWNTYS